MIFGSGFFFFYDFFDPARLKNFGVFFLIGFDLFTLNSLEIVFVVVKCRSFPFWLWGV